MDDTLYDQIEHLLTSSGMTAESSAELAFHIALHFPEHGAVLVAPHLEP